MTQPWQAWLAGEVPEDPDSYLGTAIWNDDDEDRVEWAGTQTSRPYCTSGWPR